MSQNMHCFQVFQSGNRRRSAYFQRASASGAIAGAGVTFVEQEQESKKRLRSLLVCGRSQIQIHVHLWFLILSTRGGRSHFFRLRSCFKFLNSVLNPGTAIL